MRILYIRADAIGGLPTKVCVMQVSALLRELVLTAVTYPEAYLPDGREERLMGVMLDQLREQQTAPLRQHDSVLCQHRHRDEHRSVCRSLG